MQKSFSALLVLAGIVLLPSLVTFGAGFFGYRENQPVVTLRELAYTEQVDGAGVQKKLPAGTLLFLTWVQQNKYTSLLQCWHKSGGTYQKILVEVPEPLQGTDTPNKFTKPAGQDARLKRFNTEVEAERARILKAARLHFAEAVEALVKSGSGNVQRQAVFADFGKRLLPDEGVLGLYKPVNGTFYYVERADYRALNEALLAAQRTIREEEAAALPPFVD